MTQPRDNFFANLFNLDGKVALVTGANAGIGRSIATALGRAGAQVVVAARNVVAGEAVAEEIRQLGGKAVALPAEMNSEQSIVRLMAETLEHCGALDILVNNAGIFPPYPFLEMSLHQWDEVMEVNLRGPFLCMREAGKIMVAAGGGGRIINISSNASIRSAVPDRAAYNASKAAVNRLTEDAALALAPHRILVNAVLPGPVATERMDRNDPERAAIYHQVASRIPLGAWGEPEDIAAAVLFFASNAGKFITGQTLVVDGGTVIA
jgi:NAD(P)-dependent dehydrogenase (short-subunit alcohol dehydrogenase family)